MGRAQDLFKQIREKGAASVDEFIADHQTEHLFLDFKRSSNNGTSKHLSNTDRENLAKAISGFGNSEGGVVLWGVECSGSGSNGDVASAKHLIQDARSFASILEGAVSGCTIPPHTGVQNTPLLIEDGPSGFVATYIPKSASAPHQAINRLQYFIRAGSSFVPTPHMVLAGMFGRAYPPEIFHNFLVNGACVIQGGVWAQLGLIIVNRGPGITTDLYLTANTIRVPSSSSEISLDFPDPNNWSSTLSLGVLWAGISNPGYRLPPEAQTHPLLITVLLKPPFDDELKIDCVIGANNTPPQRFTIGCESSVLYAVYNELREASWGQDRNLEAAYKIWSIGRPAVDSSVLLSKG